MTLATIVKSFLAAALLASAPQAMAQQVSGQAAPTENVGATVIDNPPGANVQEVPAGATNAPQAEGSYVPMKPTPGKGQPVYAGHDFQDQYSETGRDAYWMHSYILMPVIVVISLFVLALMLWAMFRFRAKRNPVASKTTHNSLVEVLWTLIPVIILLVIAVPSISLLAKQYEPAPADALTIKVTGYQWYWGYTYPDNGGFEIVSNMLSDEEALARGEPVKLAVDNRMVVPAGVPIKIIVTGADVIHSFAVPSLWFKMDAVPGRLNEKVLEVLEPGVYYGQCSELCGVRHGFMPIAVEALPMAQYNAWVRAQGGTPKGEENAVAAGAATETPATGSEIVETENIAAGTKTPATAVTN